MNPIVFVIIRSDVLEQAINNTGCRMSGTESASFANLRHIHELFLLNRGSHVHESLSRSRSAISKKKKKRGVSQAIGHCIRG